MAIIFRKISSIINIFMKKELTLHSILTIKIKNIMKKHLIIIGLGFIVCTTILSSCKSSHTLCPAYPPSTSRNGVAVQHVETNINIERTIIAQK